MRALAPNGVDAVFDHVGGPGVVDSFRLLAKGGTLVSYGSASPRDDGGSKRLPVLKLIGRLPWWNHLPNGRNATSTTSGRAYAARRRSAPGRPEDLGRVFDLLAAGTVTAQVAATFPLTEAAAALTLAESGTVAGKVVLVPATDA
ncbi:zinc-binding dehydrogenase [Umezawaea sp.]|uniref:zinc-binding dehydrogenase n=1 Tax=Umezawaea sp. TaxID=1955258 RepID=UPI002ED3D590